MKTEELITKIEGLGYIAEEVVKDLEFDMTSFKLSWESSWRYTLCIFNERCPTCGNHSPEYEIYHPNQSEDSDPDPVLETSNAKELITFLKG